MGNSWDTHPAWGWSPGKSGAGQRSDITAPIIAWRNREISLPPWLTCIFMYLIKFQINEIHLDISRYYDFYNGTVYDLYDDSSVSEHRFFHDLCWLSWRFISLWSSWIFNDGNMGKSWVKSCFFHQLHTCIYIYIYTLYVYISWCVYSVYTCIYIYIYIHMYIYIRV